MAKRNKKRKSAVIAIIIIVLLLLGAGFVWVWATQLPGYLTTEKAVEKYFEAITNEDGHLYKKTCYTIRWRDNYSSDASLDDKISEVLAMQSGATYGTVNIISVEKMDREYAEKMSDSLRTRYGIDQKISRVARVSFTVATLFDGQEQSSGTITRYCYKQGGKWYYLADPEVIIDMGIDE